MANVNYIGHATVLVDIGQIRVLTDPILRDRVLFLQRHGRNPAPELLEERPPDIVLLSHLHYDHADLPSLRRLPTTTTVIAPRGSGKYLERWAGVQVHDVSGLVKTYKRSRDMLKALSGGTFGGLKNLLSGVFNMGTLNQMMAGGKKIKQRSKRKRVIKRRGKIKRR